MSAHTAGLRIDLLDAILGNLKQVLTVEGRSCMRGDINRALHLPTRRIEGIQLVSGGKPDVLTVKRNPMHAVGRDDGGGVNLNFAHGVRGSPTLRRAIKIAAPGKGRDLRLFFRRPCAPLADPVDHDSPRSRHIGLGALVLFRGECIEINELRIVRIGIAIELPAAMNVYQGLHTPGI